MKSLPSEIPHVVIVGGGFAGLAAARELAGAPVRITLVDRRNHHLFQPLLYQVATAALNPADIAAPIRSILRRQPNVTVLLAEARGVDREGRRLLLDDGELRYDRLILAAGAVTSWFGHADWEAHAPGLKSIEEALDIRARLLRAFEEAEKEPDEAIRRKWLTFVVVGGGPTGVELAGALGELARHALSRDFRRIDPTHARILLVEGADRLLGTFDPELSESARRDLERLGVTIWTGCRVTAVDGDGISLGGDRIESKTILWAAGIAGSPLAATLGAPLDRGGRVLVAPDLSLPGSPEIAVVGDLAALEVGGRPVPGVAPAALQEGRHAARNILRQLRGEAPLPFAYRDKGMLATIGRASAVTQVGRFRFGGFAAWVAWLAIHIWFLIGFRNRLLVLVQWAWAYFTWQRGARLITGRPPKSPSSPPLLPLVPLLLLGVAGSGCRSIEPSAANAGRTGAISASPSSPIRFTDVAPSSGITFRYNFGDFTYDNILESSGSGVAAFDADGDGRMDLLFLNGRWVEGANDPKGRWFATATNALWRNEGNGTFTDVTARAGVGGRSWAMAATVADLDGDGHDDLFLSNYGPNTFLQANGDGTFTDRTEEAGLAGPATIHGFPKWSVGAAAFDADGDGRLELAVGNFLAFDPAYVSASAPERMPSPAEYRGQGMILYRRGDDGRWRDVTAGSGLERPDVRVMGLTALDCDDDGRLDLFSANDHEPNTLFRNLGGGRFEEIAAAAGVAVNLDGIGTGHMHATPGDVDGDGRIDLLVTDLAYGGLFRATAPCRYEDAVETSGVRHAMDGAESWGASLADFDNDGDMDLFAANGTADVLALKRPTLLANDGSGRFVDVAPGAGDYFTTLHSGRGAATLDFDDDGRLDLVVSHVDLSGKPALLRNTTTNRNHWIGLRLVPAPDRPEPVGATVRVTAGGRTQTRLFQRSRSYLSVDDPRLHFGLGAAEAIEHLEIRWPGGAVQTLRDLPVDRYHDVVEPAR